MDYMSWVTSWENWRISMGPKGGRHRRDVERFLKSHPAILYWGDSWFSTPLYLNLARQSAGRTNGMGIIIGKPGAQAQELFTASKIKSIKGRLLSSPFDLLCLSAGGNDCVSKELAGVFAKWQGDPNAEKMDGQSAYSILKKSETFGFVFEAYDALLTAAKEVQAQRPSFRVVGHAYVPIQCIGAKADLTVSNIGLVAWLKGEIGPWVWEPMKWVVHDQAQAKIFASLMLTEGFKKLVLDRLVDKYPSLFSVADFSGVSEAKEPAFWHDEIHPTEDGFSLLAKAFNRELSRVLPEEKQAAVR